MSNTNPANPTTNREFERVVLPHMEAMRARALRLTRDESEADDLVQEALMRALRFFDSYDRDQPPRAWLNTIVRNTFVNRYHALNRRRDAHTAMRAETEALGGDSLDADEALEAKDLAVRVHAAVEALPADFGAVVRLVDLEGSSYLDAAAALGVPKGTVMSRLYRGRKRLAAALEGAA
jgi:RNA polymerase sigma-70 factor (ECF subfamily)